MFQVYAADRKAFCKQCIKCQVFIPSSHQQYNSLDKAFCRFKVVPTSWQSGQSSSTRVGNVWKILLFEEEKTPIKWHNVHLNFPLLFCTFLLKILIKRANIRCWNVGYNFCEKCHERLYDPRVSLLSKENIKKKSYTNIFCAYKHFFRNALPQEKGIHGNCSFRALWINGQNCTFHRNTFFVR